MKVTDYGLCFTLFSSKRLMVDMAYSAIYDWSHFCIDLQHCLVHNNRKCLDVGTRRQNEAVINRILLNKTYPVRIVLRIKTCKNVGRNPSPSSVPVRPGMCSAILAPRRTQMSTNTWVVWRWRVRVVFMSFFYLIFILIYIFHLLTFF